MGRAGDRDPLRLLAQAPEPLLVLVDPDCDRMVHRLPDSAQVHLLPLAAPPPTAEPWSSVVVVASDRDALQRLVPTLPKIGRVTSFGLVLGWTDTLVPLTPADGWPSLLQIDSQRRGSTQVQLVQLSDRIGARRLFAEWARLAIGPDLRPLDGLRIAVHGGVAAPPGYSNARRYGDAERRDENERPAPPDVILTDDPAGVETTEHHVIGRAPTIVDVTVEPGIGPLDARILNPIGFDRSPRRGLAQLDLPAPGTPRLSLAHRELTTSAARGATEQMVDALRRQSGVVISWPAAADLTFATPVAGLAMSGTPLVSAGLPGWAAELLGADLSKLVSTPVDLADELAREEYSIALRRAAHAAFALPAWRARLGARAGLPAPYRPRVSIVLATKRADRLDHALAQVRGQVGADLELVLAPHGFEVDPRQVASLAGDHVTTQVVAQPAETRFGDVLAAAADAAAGDLIVKMDDDDWYGPDFVTDLLLARSYSGAELVGMPWELTYLEGPDQTVRRIEGTEEYGRFVAGGTMMIERTLLREVGGFRSVFRYVDASLITDVLSAGGRVYRTQGLGYIYRRADTGHTWEADFDRFLGEHRVAARWDGFRPSRLFPAS